MNILITNHHLNLFGGSETFSYTLATALKGAGHSVAILTVEAGPVAEKLIQAGIPVQTDPAKIPFSPDVIHSHHNSMAMLARGAFPETPMLFLSHGIMPGLESPPSIDTGIALFAGVSEEVQANLIQNYGLEDVVICRNGIDLERHYPLKEINAKPERVLIISNHYSNEQLALVQGACGIIGAQLNMIGLQTQSVWETESYINMHDIVISLGRGCLEAMACARAVFIFDHFGGDGFITKENYEEIRKHNFSGRRYRKQYTPDTMAAELRGYHQAMGMVNREIVENHHDIKSQAEEYLQLYKRAADLQIDYGSVKVPSRELQFYQNSWRERVQIYNQAVELNQENQKLKEQLAGIKPRITDMAQELEVLKNKERKEGKAKSLKRSFAPVGSGKFTGENLVFVFGPPRSGTTWVHSLLKEHPDVIAADVDNLDVRRSEDKTLETAIFLEDLGYSDDDIFRKFRNLSKDNPGKIILEKTPIHVFKSNRIANIFPDAAFVLLQRDGRDVVNSILKVASDKNSWWKEAPANITDAANHWCKFATKGLECMDLHPTWLVKYEDLLKNTYPEVACLNRSLGLSYDYLEAQISASASGKNIPIKGVFRKGVSGDWKSNFTPEEIAEFKSVAGEMLIQLGYEENSDW
jgi:hypothetical protein